MGDLAAAYPDALELVATNADHWHPDFVMKLWITFHHLDFAGEIRAATNFPTFHAARIQTSPPRGTLSRQVKSTSSA